MTTHEFSGGPLAGLQVEYEFDRPKTDVETLTRYPNRIVVEYDTVTHPENAAVEPHAPVTKGRNMLSAVYEFDDQTGTFNFKGWTLSPKTPIEIDE